MVERAREGTPTPEQALAEWTPGPEVRRQMIALDGGARLAAGVVQTPGSLRVCLVCDAAGPLLLHWGAAWRFRNDWQLPPDELRPAGSAPFDHLAVRTPFREQDGLRRLEWEWPRPAEGQLPRGIRFVLFQPERGAWLKTGGQDIYLSLDAGAVDRRLCSAKLAELAEQIVGAEVGASSWTLMHRFHLCSDLLGAAEDDEDALALLYAWLRYSATRHLDWQRRYNTKPRDLAHAQDRLTARLAAVWRRGPSASAASGVDRRQWARLMLTTLGRGGDGQRVRDEILQIMHRNHLKEVSGTFLEEWHQKLHNNTTPDDVVICAGYLAFLKGNGDRAAFYKTLEENGVTRDRLRSFERPIKTDPEFHGGLKDALIGEFGNFLRILKEVHSGTDLESAVKAARGRLDGGLNQKLDGLLSSRHRPPRPAESAAAVVAIRKDLAGALAAPRDDAALRDLLFLDLALEEFLRGVIERQNLSQFGRDELAELVASALRSLALTSGAREPALCANHWAELLGQPRDGRDWALHAKSVADRAARWVQGFADELHRRLQPRAEYLGEAFKAPKWAVALFSEEVIRGGPAFALSLLLRRLDPILRQEAGLGGWQVISPGQAAGRLRVADRLAAVQEERFPEAVVLIADVVDGSEEIPEGVTAVVTSDAPDLVSHLAVRARNAHVLFATCFESETYDHLKELKDHIVSLRVTPGGDVEYQEDGEQPAHKPGAQATGKAKGAAPAPGGIPPLPLSAWVVTADQFRPGVVGGKSNNLNGLRGRLPDWIQLPTSLALPFGSFEKALGQEANAGLRRESEALIAAAEQKPAEALARLRGLIQEMALPEELKRSLQDAWQRSGLPSVPWELAWRAVRRVWASQWNERAYLSRRARGTPHDRLRMAVLIQQVVEADYAYVIHTANPLTGNREEIYAELVLGLGETLVGNYPGRALGFVCRKSDLSFELISYPGKSLGLYGKGVIFRSDSNGEDLEGFAGAGLYDSFLAEEPERRTLDYTAEKLVWDHGFRDDLLRSVARIGVEVERVLREPQDVEGAVSRGRFYVVQTRPQVGL
jgi:alpha-glucan,water dikinase